ncbi:MAG TPA: helix-turn-helix transcriptional regulator [Thermoanaerobaculia bacterium]|jgi:transcriptional regulator with XRE-family HTH domain|nr:helix-turn-helix transcriptional regulator [Thermoanaerobaculia bacterium]
MKREVINPRHVGETILKLRRRAGWTQEELAEKTGINPTSVSKYERGKIPLGKVNFKKLCAAFGCLPEQFLHQVWETSEEKSDDRSVSTAVFPEAELERIYDESAMARKNLYMRTCRALFDALWGASRLR